MLMISHFSKSTARTDVFHIDLSSEESPAVCVATFPPPSPQHSLRAIDPTSQMLIYAHALDLCFVNWATHEFYTVSSREDGEELVRVSLHKLRSFLQKRLLSVDWHRRHSLSNYTAYSVHQNTLGRCLHSGCRTGNEGRIHTPPGHR